MLYIGHSRVLTVEARRSIRVAIALRRAAGASRSTWRGSSGRRTRRRSPKRRSTGTTLVRRSDGTNGFTRVARSCLASRRTWRSSRERSISAESRWIRARLRQNLPTAAPTLPEIDSITSQISVRIAPKAMASPPDQGFHNATPLDLQVDPDVGFFPFGTEPRQFDQFYIASKEAFSKPEAQISLNVELDLQTLAAPSVVNSTVGLHAYSVGLRRKLYELRLDKQVWRSLGSPADSPQITYVPVEDTVPSAIASAFGDKLYVFVTTEDATISEDRASKIWLHSHETGQATGDWKDLGTPPAQVRFSPAAIRLPGESTFARVFVVAVDGHLYSRGVSAAAAAEGDWVSHDAPNGVTLSSPPFVVALSEDVLVFATGTDADGNSVVHRLTLKEDQTFDWLSLPSMTTPFKAVSRPFAQTFGTGSEAKVCVLGLAGADEVWTLFECNTADVTSGGVEWKDLGWPSLQDRTMTTGAVHPEAHAPCGYLEDAAAAFNREGKHIFVRDVDNRLYERLDNDPTAGSRPWEDRMRPGDPNLRESPAIAVESSRAAVTLHLFAATGRNSVVKWTFESRRGVPEPNLAVQLDPDVAEGADDSYNGQQLGIVGGTGTGQSEEVSAYDGPLRLARFAAPLATTPDDTSEIEIDGESLGSAQDGVERLVALHAATTSPRTLTVLALRVDDRFSAARVLQPTDGNRVARHGCPGRHLVQPSFTRVRHDQRVPVAGRQHAVPTAVLGILEWPRVVVAEYHQRHDAKSPCQWSGSVPGSENDRTDGGRGPGKLLDSCAAR